MEMPGIAQRISGCLIGGAVGDALGAPTECGHYRDIREYYGDFRGFDDVRKVLETRGSKFIWERTAGYVTDDTVLADLLLDAIFRCDGEINAYEFAKEWETFDKPIAAPDGTPVNRQELCHWVERIPFYRNKLREIEKRELGHGEADTTGAIMYIAPVGLLSPGDPLRAELMGVDVTSVNHYGSPRDVAGGYCAVLASCFVPGMTVEGLVAAGLRHTRDAERCAEMNAMIELARKCGSTAEYIERYYAEIIGTWIPYQDRQHKGTDVCVTWNSAEVLGTALATLLITKGMDARDMMLACAKIGRDSDTICRVAGGLVGCYRGIKAIPMEWIEYVKERNGWLRLDEKSARLAEIVERTARERKSILEGVLGQ